VVPVSNGGCRICLAVSPKVTLVIQCAVLLLRLVSSVSVVPNHEIVVGGVSVQLFRFGSGAQLSSASQSTAVVVERNFFLLRPKVG
jgi:hypothetical protein